MSNTTLHIVNKGPSDTALMHHCLSAYMPGDAVLLIENAVYWALPAYQSRYSDIDIFYLEVDAQARGLSDTDTLTGIAIDDSAFVDLCVNHRRSVSWS